METSTGKHLKPDPRAIKNAAETEFKRNPLLSKHHMKNGIKIKNAMAPQLVSNSTSPKRKT